MADHFSEELQRTTAGRMSKQSSAPTGHCYTNWSTDDTGILLVEGTHVHWQATAEQSFSVSSTCTLRSFSSQERQERHSQFWLVHNSGDPEKICLLTEVK